LTRLARVSHLLVNPEVISRFSSKAADALDWQVLWTKGFEDVAVQLCCFEGVELASEGKLGLPPTVFYAESGYLRMALGRKQHDVSTFVDGGLDNAHLCCKVWTLSELFSHVLELQPRS
jgi:predicted membrane-bound spermidine synthase